MFENNQLSLPLAYILVLVLCLSSLVLFFFKRWLERDLYGKPRLLFYGLFGLVLTDLQMPKMDGDALLREIRADARLASLPVHVITADVQAQIDCAAVGFDSIIIKPVTLAKLDRLLRQSQA